MYRPAALPALTAAVSLTRWLETLSPCAVATYVFTGYDSLLSHMTMELLLDEDFPRTPEQADTPTVANLKKALAELYAGSTCEVGRTENHKLRVAITVPEGKGDAWPSQIVKPDNVEYPNRQHEAIR